MEYVFGKGWLGDLPDYAIQQANGLKEAKNVIPYNYTYYPVFGPSHYLNTAFSPSTDGLPLGSLVLEGSDGSKKNYIFFSKKFYRFQQSGATELTCYASEISHLSVVKYGDWIVVTDGVNNPKVLKGSSETTFQDLGGSPPKAKFAFFDNGHLIFANLIENSTSYPKRIRWSAREDIENWTESLTTGADYQDFPDNTGQITGLGRLGENFIIFFEDSISIGSYSGGLYTFSFSHNVYSNIGSPYPKSIISIGSAVFFWGRETIYRIDSNGIQDIAYGRVRKSVFSDFNKSLANRMSVTFDYVSNLIMWSYCSQNATNPDRILVYNLNEDMFTLIELDHHFLFSGNLSAPSDLDSETGLIDDANILIDNPGYLAEMVVPMVLDKDYYISTFTGERLQATLEFPELESWPDVLHCRGAKFFIDGNINGSVDIKSRYSRNENYNEHGVYPLQDDGKVDFRATNRILKATLYVSGFDKIYPHFNFDVTPWGRR